MCGISGIVDFSGNMDLLLKGKRMLSYLNHRGPDHTGYFIREHIFLGATLLSTVGVSVMGHQPITDPKGRYTIVFNGVIYNFSDIKKHLKGFVGETENDTEVLLAAWCFWGIDCLKYIKGMFSFAVWDAELEILNIVRDPMGVKPLYFYIEGNKILFSSELRSILSVKDSPNSLNEIALFNFLKYQSVVSPTTLIDGLVQLDAGHYLEITRNGVKKLSYFSITESISDLNSQSYNQILKQTKALIFQAVERRTVGGLPMGIFLSGGIDSAAILGVMKEVSSQNLMAFTLSFGDLKNDEGSIAQKRALEFGVNHTLVEVNNDELLNELVNAVNVFDTPSVDGLNTYLISKALHKSSFRVAMSGVGGDELFAGYKTFGYFKFMMENQKLLKSVIKIGKSVIGKIETDSGKLQRIKTLLNINNLSISSFYPISRQVLNIYAISKLTKLSTDSLTADIVKSNLEHKLKEIEKFPLLSQYSIAEYLSYSQNTLLKDADQMGMAMSTEIREPFFDTDLINYILNVPDKFKMKNFKKTLLVDSLNGILNKKILSAPKKGFDLPLDYWIRNELHSFCERNIIDLSQRGIMNEKEVLKFWAKFKSNKYGIRWTDIWTLVVLQHWLEKNEVVC